MLGAEEKAGELVFDLTSLDPDAPGSRQYVGVEGTMSDQDRAAIKKTMLGPEVLDTQRFPKATFTITSAKPMDEQAAGDPGRYRFDGKFDARRIWPEAKGALPALGMPIVILGGLYGGLFTPTEAAAAACGYALAYGLITGRGGFVKELLPVAARSLNLTAVILFLVGSVGVFQFLAANMYWPQRIT